MLISDLLNKHSELQETRNQRSDYANKLKEERAKCDEQRNKLLLAAEVFKDISVKRDALQSAIDHQRAAHAEESDALRAANDKLSTENASLKVQAPEVNSLEEDVKKLQLRELHFIKQSIRN